MIPRMKIFFFAIILSMSLNVLADVVWEKKPPPLDKSLIEISTSTVKGFLNQAIARIKEGEDLSVVSESLDQQVNDYFKSFEEKRVALYVASHAVVSIPKRNGHITTTVNGRTEKKTDTFMIDTPLEGMVYLSHKFPVQKTSGKNKRIKPSSLPNKNHSVSFELVLVEPDLSEKDPRVTYWGEVVYGFNQEGAANAAKMDSLELSKLVFQSTGDLHVILANVKPASSHWFNFLIGIAVTVLGGLILTFFSKRVFLKKI